MTPNFDFLTDPPKPEAAKSPPADARPQRRWARKQLTLPGDAPPERCRSAVLEQLEEENFLPAETMHECAWILEDELLGIAGQPQPRFLASERERMGREIAAFAAVFFQVDPPDRLRRWNELRASANFGVHVAWLELLKPGLAWPCATVTLDSPVANRLVQHLRELFVLLPPQRALRRRAMKHSYIEYHDELLHALQLVRRQYPDLCACGEDLLAAVAGSPDEEFEALVSIRASGSQAHPRQWEVQPADVRPSPATQQNRRPTTAANKEMPIGLWIAIGIFAMIISTIFRAASIQNRASPNKTSLSRPAQWTKYDQEALEQIFRAGKAPALPAPKTEKEKKADETLRKVLGLPPRDDSNTQTSDETSSVEPRDFSLPLPDMDPPRDDAP
jgi:hypothetical protein